MNEKTHNITLEDRCHLKVTECSEVISFNDTEIVLDCGGDSLVICGERLRVEEVSKSSGEVLIASDIIDSIIYKKGQKKTKEGFIGRLFK